MPMVANSPWILRYPQVGFSFANRRTILHGAGRNARSTWTGLIRPSAPDQVSMPAQKRLRLDEEPSQTPTAQEPTQTGEQGPVAGPQGQAAPLATEDGHFVPEHDEFHREFAVLSAVEAEQLEESDEGHVQERQCHGPFSTCPSSRRKSS
jgi:hypothetical protein